jgi:iron(II)-dependent oxidoreductase
VDHFEVAAALTAARAGTDELLAPLSDEELVAQVSPLQSPLVWDFAHIAYFEELWILRRVGGAAAIAELHDDVYDAFSHERSERGALPILKPAAARAYAADVRERSLGVLVEADLDAKDPLLHDGFVFGLALQHELQHQETMLQTLSLRDTPYAPPRRDASPTPRSGDIEVTVGAGPFTMGATNEPWAYDNEREPHEVELPAFAIDVRPVSNAAFASFVAEAYSDRRMWTDQGWAWRENEAARAPLHWVDGSRLERRRFGRTDALEPSEPVEHVSWHEASAFARWTGKRLPTEHEWEKACREGVLGGAGHVWEWTSSSFEPYPGFAAFPYAEYSEVFFGNEYRVLRGGSWATNPLVARVSFRNWDYPIRRQIFSGFRCARDA